MVTRHIFAVWPVPYACVQRYLLQKKNVLSDILFERCGGEGVTLRF